MTTAEAKSILLRYRRGIPVIEDPALAEALQLAKENADLGAWLDQHCAAQQEIAAQLRSIAPPPELREKILAGLPAKKRKPRKTILWSAAAAAALLLAFAAFWFRPESGQTLALFEARMASFALREYSMDIVTNDSRAVRAFLKAKDAPSDFSLPKTLAQTEVKGGARLSWQNQPVAMICFKLDPKETLYLFVLPAQSLNQKELPRGKEFKSFSRLSCATWMENGNVYFLAAETAAAELQKFLAACLPRGGFPLLAKVQTSLSAASPILEPALIE